MVKKVSKRHYLASHGTGSLGYVKPYRGYSTDGEESQRSDYISRKHKRSRSAQDRHHSHLTDGEASSDIYITSGAYRAPSEYSRGSRQSRAPSHYSYRSRPASVASTSVKTKIDRKHGMVVETMSAPNPFCPNTKGLCCLMLLLNLAIILITLGFVIVIQFFEPFFVWILGIVFLVFGFLTLIGSLIYCVTVCRDVKSPEEVARGQHYWTHHWQKNIGAPPEIHYAPDYLTDTDHYSVSEKNGRRSRY
ncbi:uncharacterized protein LOC106671162 [Cimex lectularius]|uniref:Uncharacterized protein n=1 Tax=Cimex lectularius TaxID=79782 RepID=A0A8I6TGX5_CIMLE|nr:uncharacterized protein LOC106671162 [Cimex lectularius]XP_014257530.1 uncharacterized protein LOC106671162 [Cimex lectularius]XP_014257531.1 uncharacterized protein LOC106671162 [Cimex lectularius]